LVEVALVLPVIMMLLFGIIEYSSAYNDASAVADATRQGGRVASTLGANASMQTSAADAVKSALLTLPSDEPQTLYIYESNAGGYPLPTGNTSFSSCNTNCFRYSWASSTKTWTFLGGSWATTAQEVCNPPLDQVGIYVKIRHPFITGLFGSTLNLDDHAVFRFEPSSAC
jgi:hypothetical protein